MRGDHGLSTPERNEHTGTQCDDDVVDEVLVPYQNLLEHVVTGVESECKPVPEEKLGAEPCASGYALRRRVVGHAGADGYVEVEAADAVAHPPQLAVSESPDEMTEVEPSGPVGPIEHLDLWIPALVRVGDRTVETGELNARFESEVFAEMKGVGAAAQ